MSLILLSKEGEFDSPKTENMVRNMALNLLNGFFEGVDKKSNRQDKVTVAETLSNDYKLSK